MGRDRFESGAEHEGYVEELEMVGVILVQGTKVDFGGDVGVFR